MARFRVERTEVHTRVWPAVEADNEDEALETYFEEADDEEESYHSGEPDVRVTKVSD